MTLSDAGTDAASDTATDPAEPQAAPPFPETRGREKGYDKAAVDAFLEQARKAFEADAADAALTSGDVRRAGFPLVRHGYVIAAVDAALGRIEDAFAARERERALSRAGARAWVGRSRDLGQEILDRLSRPPGHRFARVGPLRYGYRIDEVDIVADKLASYLESGEPLTVEQVRTVAFRMQRGGYREAQVDAVLDAVVEVMLAIG
ncbi:DivIVA domain-containing protein [Microbacterium sp. zg-Y818]|uniref:DivIVA domain-containing protein n=1 Tax=unclassified Microbacterium TaxID=2609290 RepID=UPI00214C2C5F|nr:MULTISPECIES: DivIVA domain-containing protein [unclassified Microbacterium]MCR2801060.1 DivIVA domain-containing protein [Microbacterium sp. zg.Y818]WIM23765.1 DivIVA domain-containing protein [Microbacterium sp. zg-Y818]